MGPPHWTKRLWGHSKGQLGAPEPHLSGPIPPQIRPERGNPLFWPLGTGTPQRAKKKGRNGAKPEPATGMAGADAREALGTAGAMGRAELMTGFVAPHSTSALGQLASCVQATSADSDTQ